MARFSCVALLASAAFVVSNAFVSPQARLISTSISARQQGQRYDHNTNYVFMFHELTGQSQQHQGSTTTVLLLCTSCIPVLYVLLYCLFVCTGSIGVAKAILQLTLLSFHCIYEHQLYAFVRVIHPKVPVPYSSNPARCHWYNRRWVTSSSLAATSLSTIIPTRVSYAVVHAAVPGKPNNKRGIMLAEQMRTNRHYTRQVVYRAEDDPLPAEDGTKSLFVGR